MPSRVIDFDPVEWKELEHGMFCHRQNRTMIVFRCEEKKKEE
jgi:hypothetical protein